MLPDSIVFKNSMVDDISKLVWLIFLFGIDITFQQFSTEGRPFFYVVCIHPHGISMSIVNKKMIEAIVI